MQGGVRVLLGLDDPDDEVGELDDPVDLEPVRGLDGVEVRQVEEHQSVQRTVLEAVAPTDLEPVQQRIHAVAPRRRLALGRRRPAPPDRRELGSGERIEEQRLPDAGRPCQRDDGRSRRRGRVALPPSRHGARRPNGLGLEPAVGDLDCLGERRQPAVEAAAHEARRTASTAACSRASPSASVAAPSTRRIEARGVGAKQLVGAFDEVPAGLGGELAHGLVAEERLEDLLAERRRPARDDDLDAREPPGVREHRQHHRQAGAVDAERCQPRRRPLGLALSAHELHDVALPGAHLLLGLDPQALRGPTEPGRGLEQRLPCRRARATSERRAPQHARRPPG